MIEFARQIAENRLLTPEELGELARRMVETKDSSEADGLQEKIVRGFYGGESHAWNSPTRNARGLAHSSRGGDA